MWRIAACKASVGVLQGRERESLLAVLVLQQPDDLLRAVRGAVPLLQQGGGRTQNRGQRRAQLVTHHGHEPDPLPLQLLERRQVQQRNHNRLDFPVRGAAAPGCLQELFWSSVRCVQAVSDPPRLEVDRRGVPDAGFEDHVLNA